MDKFIIFVINILNLKCQQKKILKKSFQNQLDLEEELTFLM